jgi:VIT1/CCC1 family predicted Fe2+/Mn2+ transporter
MDKNLLKTIFNAIALAMGVAVIVMQILGTLDPRTAVTALSVGVAALAIAALQK